MDGGINQNYVGWKRRVRSVTRVLITGSAMFGFATVLTWVVHNWGHMAALQHRFAILLLLLYLLPAIHLWGKRQDTVSLAIIAYLSFLCFQGLFLH